MKEEEKKQIPAKIVLNHYLKSFSSKDKKLYILGVFFQTVRQISFVVSPYLYKKIFDYLSTTNLRGELAFKHLLSILLIYFYIRVFAWICARATSFIFAKLHPRVYNHARNNAYGYLINHSYAFFTTNFTGGLTQKVNKYADSLWILSERITLDFLPLFVKIFGMLIVLFFVDKRLVVWMGLWIFIFLIVSFFISRKRKPLSLQQSLAKTDTNAHLSDTLSNQNSIALFSAYGFEKKSFSLVTSKLKDIYIKRNIFDAKINAFYSGFVTIVEFILIGGSLYLWSQNEITLGTIVLLQTYIINLMDDIWGFSRIVQAFEESYSEAQEMVEILETPYEVRDAKNAQTLTANKADIMFDKVTFSYDKTNEVIANLNLEIKAGQKIGLVGQSGSGKSTLVKLLLRLFEINSGSIKINTVDIKNITQDSLHNLIGFVPQDPSLFHRSLMDNIRYGRRDATDQEVIEASKKAHAHEFISKLPDGYNTSVGERGIKLSGGERQRIAIARAILKNAPILILDEATSALDSESESLIQDALDVLMDSKTVIIIAHRLSTIQYMDRILVIDNGQIVEDGSHDTLLKNADSLYKKLWDLQAGGFIE